MTGEYTFVTPERQNELTRRIQKKLAAASQTAVTEASVPSREVPSSGNGGDRPLASPLIQ
jgi:hypothetical protein